MWCSGWSWYANNANLFVSVYKIRETGKHFCQKNIKKHQKNIKKAQKSPKNRQKSIKKAKRLAFQFRFLAKKR